MGGQGGESEYFFRDLQQAPRNKSADGRESAGMLPLAEQRAKERSGGVQRTRLRLAAPDVPPVWHAFSVGALRRSRYAHDVQSAQRSVTPDLVKSGLSATPRASVGETRRIRSERRRTSEYESV